MLAITMHSIAVTLDLDLYPVVLVTAKLITVRASMPACGLYLKDPNSFGYLDLTQRDSERYSVRISCIYKNLRKRSFLLGLKFRIL